METEIDDVYGNTLAVDSGKALGAVHPVTEVVWLDMRCEDPDARSIALDAAGVEALIADLTARLAKMRGEAATEATAR